MACNRIQFRKGLSETLFGTLYGTEGLCRKAIAHWRWPEGFICPACGGTEHCVVGPRELYQVQRLPTADLVDRGHDLQFHQGAADDMVPCRVPYHPDQAGYFLNRAWPPSWHDADDRLEDQDQARRGDADRQRQRQARRAHRDG